MANEGYAVNPPLTAASVTAIFASAGLSLADNKFTITGSSDATKIAVFEVDGFTTGTTRTFTLPNATGTLAILGLAQTWSAAQTFAAITATSITNSGLTSGRIPLVTTSGLITDSAAVTWTTTSVKVGDGTANADIIMDGAAGSNRTFRFYTNGVLRWRWRCNSTAEGGSNSGSNLNLDAYDDTGTLIDAVLSVTRVAGGGISTPRPLSVTSTTASTSTTTGCAIFSGGIGVAGDSVIGGTTNFTRFGGRMSFSNSLDAFVTSETRPTMYSTSGAGTGIFAEAGTMVLSPRISGATRDVVISVAGTAADFTFDRNGKLSVAATTDATTVSAASMALSGGLGIAKTAIIGKGMSAGVTATATAAGTTTLTIASARTQVFTGTTTQTCQLPAANAAGAGVGVEYLIKNLSTGNVTVQRAGSDTINNTSSVTSVVLAQWGVLRLVSDGVSAWEVL